MVDIFVCHILRIQKGLKFIEGTKGLSIIEIMSALYLWIYLPNGLLVAKLNARGLNLPVCKLLSNNLSGGRQSVQTSSTRSQWNYLWKKRMCHRVPFFATEKMHPPPDPSISPILTSIVCICQLYLFFHNYELEPQTHNSPTRQKRKRL